MYFVTVGEMSEIVCCVELMNDEGDEEDCVVSVGVKHFSSKSYGRIGVVVMGWRSKSISELTRG
jgi:hypothetical protein